MIPLREITDAMDKCEQTKGQSVLEHGQNVLEHYCELENITCAWRLPDWFSIYNQELKSNCHPDFITYAYLRCHDCGKPACRTVDADGKIHFPNHAEVSKQTFLSCDYPRLHLSPEEKLIVANLIGWDMVIHTSTAEEIQNYLDNVWDIQDACTLLLAAISELHSNARLFGGTDTNSFKAKLKTLDRRGNQICKHYFKEKS